MSAPRSPTMGNNGMSSGFNTYTGQLAVSVQENGNGQWNEGAYPSAYIYITVHKVVQKSNSLTELLEQVKFLRIIQFRTLYLPFCYIRME